MYSAISLYGFDCCEVTFSRPHSDATFTVSINFDGVNVTLNFKSVAQLRSLIEELEIAATTQGGGLGKAKCTCSESELRNGIECIAEEACRQARDTMLSVFKDAGVVKQF